MKVKLRKPKTKNEIFDLGDVYYETERVVFELNQTKYTVYEEHGELKIQKFSSEHSSSLSISPEVSNVIRIK